MTHRNARNNNLNPTRKPNAAKYRSIAARSGVFASVVNRTRFDDPGGCWIWTGRISDAGYGLFTDYAFGQVLAHRLVLFLVNRPIPDDMVTDHTCHNPELCAGGVSCPHRRCVNPDHLAIVTSRENILRGNGYYAKKAREKAARN